MTMLLSGFRLLLRARPSLRLRRGRRPVGRGATAGPEQAASK